MFSFSCLAIASLFSLLSAPVALERDLLTMAMIAQVAAPSSQLRQDPSLELGGVLDDYSWPMPSGGRSQDPRAALDPAQASHGQPRPTSSEDTNGLRQHDEGTLRQGNPFDAGLIAPFDVCFLRMYCATPGRGLLGEKQARR